MVAGVVDIKKSLPVGRLLLMLGSEFYNKRFNKVDYNFYKFNYSVKY